MDGEEETVSEGLPRGLTITFALLALGAIVTGTREGVASDAVVAPEHFDTAFVRANGFMMDSLRLGRNHAASAPMPPAGRHLAPRTRPASPDTLATRDSIARRYSPRGCMPE